MGIKIYNTLTHGKEDLVPRDEGKIAMYVCGPTVYNYIHIGNARTFLNFDMIRRYLEFSGYDVTFVQNVTDVDDKIINRATEEGDSPQAVARKYLDAFEEDMAALGVRPPDIAPRATDCIPEMLEVIGGLVEKDYAYESGGDVYFEVSKFPGYGKLSRRNLEEQQSTGQTEEESRKKRNPGDFALWKAARSGEPSWDSPWGPGRPGWHIECSTMSVKHLGNGFDIHGGGQDLIFPHHENEIAQAEAYSGGERFARYWAHSGMLNIEQEKMSKSLGNIRLLREVLEEHDADTVRMLMLGTLYRNPSSFGKDSLAEASASLDRVKNCMFEMKDLLRRFASSKSSPTCSEREVHVIDFFEQAERDFRSAMDDDFNSAAALGVIFGLVKEINIYMGEVQAFKSPAAKLMLSEADLLLEKLCGALGLFQGGFQGKPARSAGAGAEGPEAHAGPTREQLIDLLLSVRERARQTKNFELADSIRDGLAAMGVRVEDVKDGYRWHLEW